MLLAMNSVISLSNPVGEDNDTELGEFVEDKTSSIDLAFDEICTGSILDLIFNTNILTEQEKVILKLRLGIGGEKPKTLEEVGEIFGVTRERIRQREVKALEKLKRNREIRQYRDDADLVYFDMNTGVKKYNLKK